MELTEADWFSRVWTFQELVLSRELFVTLQSCVSWRMLKPLLHCDEGFEKDQPGLNHRSRDNYTAARLVRFLKFAERHHASLRYFVGGSEEYQYLHLSGISAMRHATVPKDHVFAILGLLDAATQSLIQVDYSKTDAQVFREFLELALKTSCAARILPRLWEAFATVPIITTDLPSWCLDFQNETDARLGVWVVNRAFSEAIKRAFADAAHLRVSPEDGRIFLKVLEVDVVSTQCAGECPEWSPGDYSISGAIPLMVWIKCVYDDILSDSGGHPSAVEMRLESFLGMLDGCGEWRHVALRFLITASLLPAEDFTLCKLVSHVKHGLHATHELRREILENINTDPEHKG